MPDLREKRASRPLFPKRAVVTAGMPNGNKEQHIGHIGGPSIRADAFARFLRDRIGAQNVIFQSGTDCYGSPNTEDYRKKTESGEYSGSIEDFVAFYHERQKEVLAKYLISFDFYGASALPPAGPAHAELTAEVLETLFANGHLVKLSTSQFFDTERGVFLNGRQVVGRCPVAGCQSEKGYADECDLGHQYAPGELLEPRSALTGTAPEMREIENLYLDLEKFRPLLEEWAGEFETRPTSKPFSTNSIREFLEPPVIYLKRDYLDELSPLSLPCEVADDGKSKTSVRLVFKTLAQREAACVKLSAAGINFRTGKTLVPFRLTGNLDWGVPAPEIDGLKGLTVWVWPESLWAPIAFTKTFLASKGGSEDGWKDWWCDPEAKVYQFIGQDNIYFYGPAEAAIFMGLQGPRPSASPSKGQLSLPDLVVNGHVLFLDKKASSSGKVKPPTARELLDFYTPEQLRAHFLGLGLGLRSVNLMPKPFNPAAKEGDADPVLKEGNLLTNVLNRVARSCFYTAQKYFDGKIPPAPASQEALDSAEEAALDVERLMSRCDFHQVMNLMDAYIRNINKMWAKNMREADAGDDGALRAQTLVDAFHLLRVASVLMHPVAPTGTELLAEYMNLGEGFFSWEHIFEPVDFFIEDRSAHALRFLEPRFDFFAKHESQLNFD